MNTLILEISDETPESLFREGYVFMQPSPLEKTTMGFISGLYDTFKDLKKIAIVKTFNGYDIYTKIGERIRKC